MPSKTGVRVSFSRPANSTPYTIGDVVGDSDSAITPMEFAGLVRGLGGSGLIVAAKLTTSRKASTQEFRVHLFQTAAGAALQDDNEAFKQLLANDASYIGCFDLAAVDAPADSSGSDLARVYDGGLRVPIWAASDSSSIFAILETLTGDTPASGETFALTLVPDLDP